MRVILYTGKGGVGKTTVAAATAVRCAELGQRTLVISTDAAHSLGDSLDSAIGEDPQPVAPNLWAQEVNALHQLESHWDRIRIYLSSLFSSQGVDDIVAEELASPPGMEEVAALMQIRNHRARASTTRSSSTARPPARPCSCSPSPTWRAGTCNGSSRPLAR